ncbi:hypothetical protein CLV74_12150 [Donghicola tyrosinivorans]|uniref:Glycosyl transferase family 1 n=1 Tax=Donghicola tyrosinivorans TaxID=1652492 RepID=A0A2T0WDD4_9RHOB|nr:hypothetical protein CLV74_12150 [Donghicola tyrosinivorans]
MPQTKNLTNLPEILPNLALLTVHGEGRGGGESVARLIETAYVERGVTLVVTTAREAKKALLELKEHLLCSNGTVKRTSALVLFSSGPRDLPLILFAIRHRIPFAVYMQVPYTLAVTWRDPIHAIAVMVYVKVSSLASQIRIANSETTARSFSRPAEIVLPIIDLPEKSLPEDSPMQNSLCHDKNMVFVTACRLYPERGRGSKDLDALEQLLTECRALNAQGGIQYSVQHYGDVDPQICVRFAKYKDVLSFGGFNSNWLRDENGPFFFFSVYEGFGLSAYEAAQAGKPVFVNSAFPSDLTSLFSNIHFVHTGSHSYSILKQMLNALSTYN